MKTLKITMAVVALVAGSFLPVKKAVAQESSGKWILTIYSSTHWSCSRGGGMCCPGWDC